LKEFTPERLTISSTGMQILGMREEDYREEIIALYILADSTVS
jgi:hypothetical protein